MSDFPDIETPATSGVTFSSSTVSAYIDDGAVIPVIIWNPSSLDIAYSASDELIATVDAARPQGKSPQS